MSCNVENGIIVADSDSLNQVVNNFLDDMKTQNDRIDRFKKDPAVYFGMLGFNVDTQREILVDFGIGQYASDWCIITCICTTCCITHLTLPFPFPE